MPKRFVEKVEKIQAQNLSHEKIDSGLTTALEVSLFVKRLKVVRDKLSQLEIVQEILCGQSVRDFQWKVCFDLMSSFGALKWLQVSFLRRKCLGGPLE